MKNKDIIVSIVVPIYNVELYIQKCITSLISQQHSAIEIILVDDGSSDNSGLIADEFAQKDKRITVIHQKNSGVSAARNAGILASNGEYVMFVDGDDWVDSTYVSYFLELLIHSKCDVGVNTNYYRADGGICKSCAGVFPAEKGLVDIYSGKLDVAVWNKIYKRKLLIDNNIKFDNDIWYGEGMLFNVEVFQYVDTIVIGDKAVYHQVFNLKSAMRNFNLNSNLCGIRSLELQKTKWIKNTKEIEEQWLYHKYRFNQSIINGIIRSKQNKQYKKELKHCIQDLRKNISIPMRVEKSNKARLNWILYYCFPVLMAKRAAIRFKKQAIQNK